MKTVYALALVAGLAGCATSPAVIVPTTVEVPVDASPKATMPARPVMAVPASHAAADVVRAAALRIEAWRSYALQLEALLAPYTGDTPTPSPPAPAK
jgi:hypothetical protein